MTLMEAELLSKIIAVGPSGTGNLVAKLLGLIEAATRIAKQKCPPTTRSPEVVINQG